MSITHRKKPQFFSSIKETQTDPQGLAQTLAEKEAEINSLREDKVQLQSALEEKSQVTEEIQAELARVKEQLKAGGDIQTKPDQTGSMNFDLLLKEKETELEKVKTEFANFRESLQVLLKKQHSTYASVFIYMIIIYMQFNVVQCMCISECCYSMHSSHRPVVEKYI